MSDSALIDAMSRINGQRIAAFQPDQLASISAQLMQLGRASTTEQQSLAKIQERSNEIVSAYGYASASADKPFPFSNGIAIIPVWGMLLNRFSYSWGYATGYAAIRGQANAAVDDDDVELIVYDVNSYGGEAAGNLELAAELFEISSRKPTLAVVDSAACSAAYAIASSARKIVSTPSSTVGSIGVIAMHMDMSGYLKNNGLNITIIAEGAQKAAGNPYEPLSPQALADISDRVSKRYAMFIDLVAVNRASKGLDADAIRATESRAYLSQDAIDLKLIDAIQTPAEAVSAFLAELGSDEPNCEEDDESMADITEAAHNEAVAKAKTEGATAERERVKAITGSDEAKLRPKAAQQCAMMTSMSADEAKTFLAGLPEEAKAEAPAAPAVVEPGKEAPLAGAGALAAAMQSSGGGAGVEPNPDTSGKDGDKSGVSRAKRALNSTFGEKTK